MDGEQSCGRACAAHFKGKQSCNVAPVAPRYASAGGLWPFQACTLMNVVGRNGETWNTKMSRRGECLPDVLQDVARQVGATPRDIYWAAGLSVWRRMPHETLKGGLPPAGGRWLVDYVTCRDFARSFRDCPRGRYVRARDPRWKHVNHKRHAIRATSVCRDARCV